MCMCVRACVYLYLSLLSFPKYTLRCGKQKALQYYMDLSLLSIQQGCITHLKQNDIAKAEEDELLVHNKT